tara:strand:+ start:621 stop:767 length:147 start_codon:yes stop_codon:yes gene_type:complete
MLPLLLLLLLLLAPPSLASSGVLGVILRFAPNSVRGENTTFTRASARL